MGELSLVDSNGRKIDYVRISLTDRCNFRCVYCMPEDGVEWIAHSEIMRYEDVLFLLSELGKWGVKKARFTGGEPLLRKGLTGFLRDVRRGLPDMRIAVTTNGALLVRFAKELEDIGIAGINVSLDTLDKDKFREVTRGGDIGDVLSGIAAASKTSVQVKMNCVLMRGFNDCEIYNMLEFSERFSVLLRLIEFMPLDGEVWSKNRFISSAEVLEKLGGGWKERKTEDISVPAGPARYYRNTGSGQVIGVISAVSDHYCASCNRLRITANGKLRPCLFSNFSIDLLPVLRSRDEKGLREIFERAISVKPKIGVLGGRDETRHMVQIGG